MPKAMRTCPNCDILVHVRKNPCECGYTFPSKNVIVPAKNGGLKPLQVKPVTSAPIINSELTPSSSNDVQYLQNYIAELERVFQRRIEKMEEEVKSAKNFLYKSQRDWYNFQCEKIYQKAFEHYGGAGEIYLTEDPEILDSNLKFKPPSVRDRSADFPETDVPTERKEELADNVLSYLKPLNLKEKENV